MLYIKSVFRLSKFFQNECFQHKLYEIYQLILFLMSVIRTILLSLFLGTGKLFSTGVFLFFHHDIILNRKDSSLTTVSKQSESRTYKRYIWKYQEWNTN